MIRCGIVGRSGAGGESITVGGFSTGGRNMETGTGSTRRSKVFS